MTFLESVPGPLLGLALALVVFLDAIPLVGILVPADIVVLTTSGATHPLTSLGWIIAGCLTGWSLTFLAGHYLGERLRHSRFGARIGPERWAAADRVVREGGTRILVTAPFLPFVNTLVPMAAGGLRMPYRKFLPTAVLAASLWGGLYVGLGMLAEHVSSLLPTGNLTVLVTIALGLTFGWIALLGTRRMATVRS